jgi:hypothetical protein
MLGLLLSTVFQSISSKIPLNNKGHEIALFRALSNSSLFLSTKTPAVHLASSIIHQQYCWFDVDASFYFRGYLNAQREIGDILIVTYSPKMKTSKITFMQCKHYHKLMKTGFKSFKGDNFQYYLMCERPFIKRTKNVILSARPDLFSSAVIPSVTSYGVFYNATKHYDMAYYNSSKLDITGKIFTSKSVSCDIDFNGKFGNINRHFPLGDVDGEQSVIGFGDRLENLNIGTIIDSGMLKLLIAEYPTAPMSFIAMELDDGDRNKRNKDENMINRFSYKTAVFINVDEIKKINDIADFI